MKDKLFIGLVAIIAVLGDSLSTKTLLILCTPLVIMSVLSLYERHEERLAAEAIKDSDTPIADRTAHDLGIERWWN